MKKSKSRRKSFNWYELSQRFSIRKYHFGAASVLLGTALILGGNAAQAEEVTTSADSTLVATQVQEASESAAAQSETASEVAQTATAESTAAQTSESQAIQQESQAASTATSQVASSSEAAASTASTASTATQASTAPVASSQVAAASETASVAPAQSEAADELEVATTASVTAPEAQDLTSETATSTATTEKDAAMAAAVAEMKKRGLATDEQAKELLDAYAAGNLDQDEVDQLIAMFGGETVSMPSPFTVFMKEGTGTEPKTYPATTRTTKTNLYVTNNNQSKPMIQSIFLDSASENTDGTWTIQYQVTFQNITDPYAAVVFATDNNTTIENVLGWNRDALYGGDNGAGAKVNGGNLTSYTGNNIDQTYTNSKTIYSGVTDGMNYSVANNRSGVKSLLITTKTTSLTGAGLTVSVAQAQTEAQARSMAAGAAADDATAKDYSEGGVWVNNYAIQQGPTIQPSMYFLPLGLTLTEASNVRLVVEPNPNATGGYTIDRLDNVVITQGDPRNRPLGTLNSSLQEQLGGTKTGDVTFDPHTGIVTGTVGGTSSREGANVQGVYAQVTDSTGTNRSDNNNALNFAKVQVEGLKGFKNEGDTFTEEDLFKLISFRTWAGTSYGKDPLVTTLESTGQPFQQARFLLSDDNSTVPAIAYSDFVTKMEVLDKDKIAKDGQDNVARIKVTYGNTFTSDPSDTIGEMIYEVHYGYTVSPTVEPKEAEVTVKPGTTYDLASNVDITDPDKATVVTTTVTITDENGVEVHSGPLASYTFNTPGRYTVKVDAVDDSATKYAEDNKDTAYVEGTGKQVDLLPDEIRDLTGTGSYVVVVAEDKQEATITFKDTAGNELDKVTEEGDSNTAIPEINYQSKLDSFKAKGYAVESDEFADSDKTFDNDKDTPQNYVVTLEERIEDIDPNNPPTPGDSVDPNDPNSPVWPDSVKDLTGTETVTRTIKYVYADGSEASSPVEQVVTFTRTAKVNLVSGDVTYGDWTSTDTSFDQVDSPVITGYIADKANVAEKAGVQATDADSEEVVTYNKLGNYVPNIPGKETPEVPYTNDPNDPTKPVDPKDPSQPVIPYEPGYTPNDPDGNPLEPVDPNDPTKGYYPPTPTDPTQDTPINYVANDAKVVVNYVDKEGNEVAPSENLNGKIGEDYTSSAKVVTGYVLVETPANATGKYTETDTTVTYVYDKLGSYVPNIPGKETPEVPYTNDPNDPTKPVDPKDPSQPTIPYEPGYTPNDPDGNPLEPVDPNDPTKGYYPPTPTDPTQDTEINYVANDAKVVVNYVDKEGNEVAPSENLNGKVGEDYTSSAKVVTGYVLVETPANATGKYTETDTTVTYVYDKLGSYVPNVPAGENPIDPIQYPNDPTDPSKPGEPTTIVPHIDGYTPKDPDGNPLEPVDPNDPTQGYHVPNVPSDPTKDTPINYDKNPDPQADIQEAVIKFKDQKDSDLGQVTEEGESKTPISETRYQTKLDEFHKQGYEVVTDEFSDSDKTFDDDKEVTQEYIVTLKERVEPVKPGTDKPEPGQPVDPNDPNSPVWPDSVKDLVNEEAVTRTIKYVYAKDGSQASEDVVETLTFTREAQVNLVTGEITYGDWTSADTSFDQVDSPVITGYIADKANVAEKAGVQATDEDDTEVVTYTELGSYVPNVPGQEVPSIQYPNDPTDPTKPQEPGTPDYPVIPAIDGYTPVDPNSGEPLKPVDPNDPSKGYVPPVPTDPTKDTPIEYTENPKPETPTPENPAPENPTPETPTDNNGGGETPTPVVDKQEATITFKDTDGNELDKVTEEGDSNTAIPTQNYEDKIKEFEKKGYKVVTDEFADSDKTFDNDKDTPQNYVVTLEERIEDVDPNNPPTPGEPVDPTDPNSPVWPDSVKDLAGTETVTRTIKYVYADGSEASSPVEQVVTFTRTAKVNLVTGEVTYGDWTSADASFDQVDSPVITGYIADKASVAEKAGVQATDADSEEVVTYTELGSYVPNVPGQEVPSIQYPNDPTDPTKPQEPGTPDYPVIPAIDGYTPVDPNSGEPLKPVDPNDPTKGYYPPTPTDPTKDTPINYTENPKPETPTPENPAPENPTPETPTDNNGGGETPTPVVDKQEATITFKDTDGNELDKVTEEGDSNTAIPTQNYEDKIKEFEKKGYKVVTDEFADSDKTFDNDKDTPQNYVVTLEERIEDVDPNNPPTPGEPVDPNDPNSPVWPDSVKDLVGTETVTRTIKYVYADGSEASSPVEQVVTFTRTAKVNLVTGEVTYGDWTATDTSFDQVDSPVITGYIADKASVAEKAGVQATDADSEEVVTYTKLGNYVPNIPGKETPKVPYTNDPQDPTKPVDPKDPSQPTIPYEPGFTPVDPNTNTPLTPADPNDPTKGYIPPTPTDPTKDTDINYVANDSQVVVNYVDKAGNALIPSENLNGKVGEDYVTTGKLIQGYILVEIPANATGQFVEGGSSVTYVYEKLGSYEIEIPGQGIVEVPYPNDPNDPTKPMDPSDPDYPKVPYIDGYIPVDPLTNQPLKPVDPNDPTKGYKPPVPQDPTKNTPIKYVPANPSEPGQPSNPGTPAKTETKTPGKQNPGTPAKNLDNKEDLNKSKKADEKAEELPETGDQSQGMLLAGLSAMAAGLGLAGFRKKRED